MYLGEGYNAPDRRNSTRYSCGSRVNLLPRLVYKPHSVLPPRWLVRSSIWEIGLPIPRAAYPEFKRDEQPLHSCLALLLSGVAWPQLLLPAPVVSYTTFSPSPPNPEIQRLSVSVALSGKLLRPGCYPVTRSSECGLSSKGGSFCDRPTNLS